MSAVFNTSFRIFLSFIVLICGLFFGCGTASSGQDPEGLKEVEVGRDSFEIISTEPDDIDELMPELFGSWKTTTMKIGDLFMSEEDMNLPVREFAENGLMILHGEDGSSEEAFILEPGRVLLDEGTIMNIETLTQDSLILSQMVDGVEARYIHTRVE